MATPFSLTGKFRNKRLHIGITGSVAAYKMCSILRLFLACGLHASATLTEAAQKFVTPLLFRALGANPVYEGMFTDHDSVFPHLEPGQLADALLIAPASADFISRAAAGACGDLLACQTLAFPGPCAIAPAMNPAMWENPATRENMGKLEQRGWKIITPGHGGMACGDIGQGRLAPGEEIFLSLLSLLAPQDMAEDAVLVTMGPTREYRDCARFWSNPSSGAMGAALATAAWLRGARVTAICGPGCDCYLPCGIARVNVESAQDMLTACADVWPDMTVGMFCAAVSDFRPAECEKNLKLKKSGHAQGYSQEMLPNPDILATLAKARHPGQKVLGFAAECANTTEELAALAALKLESKNADVIAANMITGGQGAFAKPQSSLVVVDKTGGQAVWPTQPKADSAWDLCSWLSRM